MFRKSGFLRPLLAVTTLAAAAVAQGQAINVTAANASNDAIYSVVFANGGGSINVLNTDGGSLHNLTSLVFRTNPKTLQLDLLAADNGGRIVIYPGDFQFGGQTTGNTIPQQGTGPANPDGLSVDNAGDLFVVNAKNGSTSNPQLWELPTNTLDPAGLFGKPALLDQNYGSSQVLDDTLVVQNAAPSAQPIVLPGDLLVLTTNPSEVLLYAGAQPGNAQTALPCTAPPQPTIPCILVTVPGNPGGLAFWPVDNSLLVTTSTGTIYQYHQLTSTEVPGQFIAGLGNGQFKVKTGTQFGKTFAYVANNNGGDILEFGLDNEVPPKVTQQGLVTSGVQHPQGLAVTNLGYSPLTGCQGANGCDPLGNDKNNQKVLVHNIPAADPNLGNNNIIENVCIVTTDPRPFTGAACTGTLVVNTVCPGFDNTNKLVIPQTLCGGSGANGKGFALIAALDGAYHNPNNPHEFNGYQIFTDSNVDNVLLPPSGGSNPSCNPPSALGTLAWAPLAGEGLDPDGANGTNLIEVTSGCDAGNGKVGGLSLFGLGLVLNITDQVGYIKKQYNTLFSTMLQGYPAACSGSQGMICEGVLSASVAPQPPTPPPQSDGNFTNQLLQCLSTSQATFQQGKTFYDVAAVELLAADQQIAAAALMSPPFTPSPFGGDYPNPSATLQMLIENTYYNIETRLQGYTAGKTGPPSPSPASAQLPAQQPSISGTPATSVKAGTPYGPFKPSAHNFAGLTTNLSFLIQKQPSWAQFDPATGTLTGTPANTDKGTYSGIVISVTDGCALPKSLPPFTIKVTG
jgi:hypothetical protein